MEKEKLAEMTAKQKAMIGVMVVIVLVVIWQVMGLIGTGSTKPVPSATPTVNKNSGASKMGASPPSPSTEGNKTLQQNELRQAPVANDARFLQLQQMSEQKYIGKLNDLEDLKIQREIAETNQAIATAKLATVTAEKNINDLLTKPAKPEVPASAYANKLAHPGTEETAAEGSLASSATRAMPEVDYTIISVSMQLHKWNAIIGYQGKLFNVGIGDVLAADGSVVTDINKNSVTLKKDGGIRKINITTGI
ncbi:MAG: hypothetical protein K0R24_282 [Gammaproteobacteria bacterium]|jgi:hypothetical protein|nr:hypothetical protein [Gammaproteobacteria bacterium]